MVLLAAFAGYAIMQPTSPKATAVLIDKSTGRRFEIASNARSAPVKERFDSVSRIAATIDIAGSGDLESRKHRAYGALLGTVAAALLIVLYVRRSLKG